MVEAAPVTPAVVIAPPGFDVWPERTLVGQIADWCEDWLEQPDGPNAGDPWSFTDSQLRVLAHWYSFDEDAVWLFRRGTVRLMKGAGKDPVAAVMSLVELLGPSRVNRETMSGERNAGAWIDIAAVSKDQTRTTMRLMPALLSKRAVAHFGLEVAKTLVYADGGGTINAVTSSPTTLEGGRSSLAIRNEVQYWGASNEGHAMAEVIDGNLAKSRDGAARAMSFCNAHVPGEDSVAEREWDAFQAVQQGRTRVRDIFYYAVEAPPDTRLDDEDSLRAGLAGACDDSVWLSVDRLVAEVWDPRTTPSEARRKYLNQVVAAEDAWLAPHEFDACGVEDELAEGEVVALGFDGSKTEDHTALVATRVSDGTQFLLNHWDPAQHGGEVPRGEVDAAVRRAKARHDVVAFYCDVHPWESYIDRWTDEVFEVARKDGLCALATPRSPIGWDMRARSREFTLAAERYHDAVTEHALRWCDPSGVLAEHVKNARRRPDFHGVSFRKETRESTRRVDALAAAVLSRLAFWDYQALPPTKQRRRRKGKAHFY